VVRATRRRHHHYRRGHRNHTTTAMAATEEGPSYHLMDPSPSPTQVIAFVTPFTSTIDLGRFTGGSRGFNPFMTAGGSDTSHQMASDHQEQVEEGEVNTIDLNITQPPSPTLYEALPNPNPNGSGSAPPPPETPNPNRSRTKTQATPKTIPIDNRVIHWVIQLTSSARTRLAGADLGAITDGRPSDSTVRRVRFCD
jgi:hypothetical protein